MSYFAAVQGCTISVLPPVIGGSVLIQMPASTKVSFSNKGVYSGDIQVLVSGCTFSGLAQVNPVLIKISPSNVTKCKAENKLMLCVGDSGQTTEPVTFSAGQTTATSIIQIKITDAGQTVGRVS